MNESRFKDIIKTNTLDNITIIDIITKEYEQEIFNQYNNLLK